MCNETACTFLFSCSLMGKCTRLSAERLKKFFFFKQHKNLCRDCFNLSPTQMHLYIIYVITNIYIDNPIFIIVVYLIAVLRMFLIFYLI